MAKPSPAALDVMEHITGAIDELDVLLASLDRLEPNAVARAVMHVRDELLQARMGGAEVVLELLNLSEQRELMQGEIEQIRNITH
jgi:hypothetical protein